MNEPAVVNEPAVLTGPGAVIEPDAPVEPAVNEPAVNRPAVLVVDDEAGMRDTLVAILEHHGYRVSSAPDGETAFSAVQETAFDVVVMDIRMPGRDGVSVLEQLGTPPPRIILMTAYALEERLRAAVKANAFAVLHKPFDTLRMLGLVADASKADQKADQ